MIPEACCDNCVSSNVKVEENGKKFVVTNDSKKPHTRIRYDGCVLKSQISADYVVRCPEGDIIVELKGTNVDHGAKQVIETAKHFRSSVKNSGPFAGMIVAAQYPKITTTIQRAKLAFAREMKGPLHVVTKNGSFLAARVLSFKGPH